jgi:regulator of replication initiation timing
MIKDELCNVKEMSTNLQQNVTHLQTNVDNMTVLIDNLNQTNSDLVKEVKNLQSENTELKSHVLGNPKNVPNSKLSSLLIGSSMVRDIQGQDDTVHVKSISGAKLDAICNSLKECEQNNKRFDKIYVVAGSIDCEQQISTTQTITDSVKNVITQGSKISNSVHVSSILPRTDDPTSNLKGENANISIKKLCEDTPGAHFIDNDGTFRLADSSPNDALLLNDGKHLSYKGSEKLIQNLKISAKVSRNQRFRPQTQWQSQP